MYRRKLVEVTLYQELSYVQDSEWFNLIPVLGDLTPKLPKGAIAITHEESERYMSAKDTLRWENLTAEDMEIMTKVDDTKVYKTGSEPLHRLYLIQKVRVPMIDPQDVKQRYCDKIIRQHNKYVAKA